MIFKNKKAQSLIEYSMLLIVVMAVFLTIGNYLKRGIAGRWKTATDDLGDQYDPRLANTKMEYKQLMSSNTRVYTSPLAGGGSFTKREDQSFMEETKNGHIKVDSY